MELSGPGKGEGAWKTFFFSLAGPSGEQHSQDAVCVNTAAASAAGHPGPGAGQRELELGPGSAPGGGLPPGAGAACGNGRGNAAHAGGCSARGRHGRAAAVGAGRGRASGSLAAAAVPGGRRSGPGAGPERQALPRRHGAAARAGAAWAQGPWDAGTRAVLPRTWRGRGRFTEPGPGFLLASDPPGFAAGLFPTHRGNNSTMFTLESV